MRGLAAGQLFIGIFFLSASAAGAQTAAAAPSSASDLVNAVGACRSITDSAQRLTCYDAAASRLTQAVSQNELVVLNREDIRRTRRSLFGFHLPRIGLFGRNSGDEEDDPEEITATIASVRSLGYDKWQIRLQDGAVWQTTEPSSFIRPPRAGGSVVLRRGPMGSYMIRIDGQRALRAMRTG